MYKIIIISFVKFSIIGVLLSITNVFAQDKTPGVFYGFKQDTIQVRAGETFSNVIWIENTCNVKVRLVAAPGSEQNKIGLLKLPDTLTLQPNQKRQFPLKYLADQQTIRKNVQDIRIRFAATNPMIPVQKGIGFYAVLKNVQGLIMDTDQEEVYLDQVTNQARVNLRIFNNGLVPVSFHLELTEIPDGLDFIGETTNLILQPGSQKSLPFIARNKLGNGSQADFAVTIRALDVQQKQLAVRQLRIMSVSSDRRLSINNSPFYQNLPNTLALRYMTVGKSQSMYQLQGNGQFFWENNQRLNYRLNTDYYNNPGQRGINLYDTYVNYENKKGGIRVGNISESLDFNLNGKGIKGSAYLSSQRSINVYGLNNDYLLYSNFQKQRFGNTYAVNYKDVGSAGDNLNVVLLRSDNTYTGIKTALLSSAANFRLNTHQRIGFEAGASLQKLNVADRKSKPGAALGVNYNLDMDKLGLYSNNYYSSPYYDGLRKGLLQLDEALSLSMGKKGYFSARMSLMHSKPKVFTYTGTEFIPLSNNYGNTLYELGYGNQYGNWSINIKPYYYTQYMQTLNTGFVAKGDPEIWRSASARTTLDVRYNNSYHNIALSLDQGYTFRNTTEKPPAPFYSSRVNLDYQNQVMGFSAYAQFNSYYLSDAIGISGNPDYTIYSFGPTTHFAWVPAHITVNTNAMYSYYGYNHTNNYSVNSNVRWLLKGNWAVSCDIYYGLSKRGADHQYNPAIGIEQPDATYRNSPAYTYANRQIRIGLEKSFGRSTGDDLKKLELCYFEDRNGNGFRDEGEPVAPGVLVKIDNLAAITNNKGTVRFTASKNKAYSISIVNDKGWSLLQATDVFLDKNKKLDMPLVKTEKVVGSINYKADKYNEGSPMLAGIRIKAVADNGLVFKTLTNETGSFNFYLPENKYTMYVETEGMPFSISNQGENIDVKRNKKREVTFNYKDERHKVEITRFK